MACSQRAATSVPRAASMEDGNGGGGGSGSSAGAMGGGSVNGVRGVRRGGSGSVDGRRLPLPSVRMLLKRRGGMR